ncbi:MAG: hypothetical protein PVH55_12260, partial [Desulfobacterales bacterium]
KWLTGPKQSQREAKWREAWVAEQAKRTKKEEEHQKSSSAESPENTEQESTTDPTSIPLSPEEPPPFDLSGKWELYWKWSVTSITFYGSVSGDNNQWSYNGTFDSETNAIWYPAKGSGSIQCSGSGQPDSSGSPARMSCTANFPEGTLQAQSEGYITTMTRGDGDEKRIFNYKGKGTGITFEGEKTNIDHLNLTWRSP